MNFSPGHLTGCGSFTYTVMHSPLLISPILETANSSCQTVGSAIKAPTPCLGRLPPELALIILDIASLVRRAPVQGEHLV